MSAMLRKLLATNSQSKLASFLNKESKIPAKKSINHYTIGSKIGSGGFATVYSAIQQYTGTEVAIKVIEFSELASQHKSRLQNQVEIHKRLDHPSIVKIYEAIWTPSRLFIVMELVKGKDLFEYLCENGALSEQKSVVVFSQIVSAVKYLHEMGISHRDIKAENVMLDSKFNAKLVDFGLAKEFGTEKEIMFQTFCGSRSYIAPEIVDKLSYSGRQVDVWALGVTLYVMMEAVLPFDHYGNTKDQKIRSYDWQYPRRSCAQAVDIYEKIFCHKKIRMTLSSLQEHDLFRKHSIAFQSLVQMGNNDVNDLIIFRVSKVLNLNKAKVYEQIKSGHSGIANCLYQILLNKQKNKKLYKEQNRLRKTNFKSLEISKKNSINKQKQKKTEKIENVKSKNRSNIFVNGKKLKLSPIKWQKQGRRNIMILSHRIQPTQYLTNLFGNGEGVKRWNRKYVGLFIQKLKQF